MRLLRLAGEASQGLDAGLYLVGGTVRDLVLGADPRDLDLSFVGESGRIESALAPAMGAEVESRSQFGTYVLMVGAEAMDVATARRETYPRPGALPLVSPGSIGEDLGRRDFSINAMAVGLTPSDWGVLMDPFDGRADVADGVVRRPPSRQLHRRSHTDAQGGPVLPATRASTSTPERRRSCAGTPTACGRSRATGCAGSWSASWAEGRASSMLEMAQGLGVLRAVHPSLELSGDALDRLRDVGAARAGDGGLMFAALIALSAAVEGVEPLLHRLNVGVGWAKAARDTVRLRGELDRLTEPEMAPSRIFRVLEGAHPTAVSAWALVSDDPLVARRLEMFESELRHVSTLLDGNDLIALGVEEGPLVGRATGGAAPQAARRGAVNGRGRARLRPSPTSEANRASPRIRRRRVRARS